MTATIIIVGRPNVGKSTLFNRLSRSKSALVDNRPGVTRDRLCAVINYQGLPLTLVDTGGFDDLSHDPLSKMVKNQVKTAIDDADKIVFMVDGRQGVLPGDEEIAHILRCTKKDVFLTVNKIDGIEHEHLSTDFYRLGVQTVYPVSAAHGYGVKALMDDLIQGLDSSNYIAEPANQIRVAVLGKPNAGKSSMINRILGQNRLVVSDLPGTTRDTVDTPFTYRGREYLLIDTAGIRRKARVKEKIEKFSMIKAIKSLSRCHVAVILIDADQGISEQDARICGYALEYGRAVILTINKWDLIKDDPRRRKILSNETDRQLKYLSFAPRINVSALTGERVMKLFDKIDLVYEHFSKRISTPMVNKALQDIAAKKPPPRFSRGRVKFFYSTQTKTAPPTFVVFANRPDKIHFSYQRFLINQFREYFGLTFTPIKLIFKKRDTQR